MRLLLTLAIFLLASTQLLSQTIDVTATIPDRFKNFFKTKEYDESPDISDYQRQRIITLQTPTPSIPDDQINAGDDVSLTYDGFYADADGNPSPYVNSVTQFIVSLELTGNDAHKYNLTNPTVSFAATIEQQILRSSSQPESVAFQRAFSEFTLTTQDIVVETDKFIDRDLGYYRLHADSVLVYSSPKGFAIYATKGQITTPKKIGSGRTIMIYYVYVGNPNYTLGIEGQNYCTSCGSVVLPFVHFYIEPDSIVTYGTVITLHSIEADKGRDVGYTFTMGFKSATETGPSILHTQEANPIPAGKHILSAVSSKSSSYSQTITHFNVTILPRTLSLSSTPTLPSRLYDATTTLTKPSLPTLISTNLHPSDTIPTLSFTIDSSAVKPYPGTYPVLFHAHLSDPNYALTDSLFSVPFTIIAPPKQPLHASLVSTSAIYGDTLPISITPNIPGTLTTSPATPLPANTHSFNLHFLPQDTINYSTIDTTLSLTILPRTLSLSSSPTLPSRLYDATTTLTTPSLPTLISTNLLPSDALPTISFTIDSSAVKPSPGTYHVLFHAHLSNPNYALTDSLFSVPFTITPRPKQSIHASLISTSAIYGDTLPISITPNIPGILTTFPTTPLPTGNHTLTIHFLPQDTLDYFPLDTILSLTILPRTLSLSSSPSLPSRPYDATTTLTTPSFPTLISTNLLPSDALPTISFSIDSSAVKPSPGTYHVLFHAHISNPNYALTDSLFSVPFTITVAHQPIPTLTTTSLPSLTKVYDGTTSLPLADPVSLSPYAQISSARFASSNVGDHSISVNIVSTDPYILFPNDSTVISNYPYPAQGTITPCPLSLVGEMSSTGKLYDATTIAPDTIVNLPSTSGVVNNEDVRIVAQSLSFASKDATDNTILATISLSGADADNYTLPTTQISCPATISPLQLYATAPIFSSTSKEYDTSVATPSVISAPTPVGIIPSDDVTLYFTARYDSPNPGSRTIIVSYSLSGADAHNYLAPAPISIPSEITNPEPTPEPEPEPEPTPTPTPTPISASLVISNSNSSAPNDAFCPGEQLTLSLSVTSGEPVAFSLASSSPAIHDIPLSPIPDNFVIRIPITSSSSYGPASALLALFDSSRVATTQIPLSLTIRPDTSFVDFSYGNTLSISDPSRFTSFQWMSNNIPIPAATMPSYYANPLAPASYSCRITTPGGLSLQTCPLVINASPTAPVSLSVTPSPVRTCSSLTVRLANAGQTLSVKVFDTYGNPQETHTVLNGAPFTITVDQGTYILLVSDGNTSAVSKILVK